MARVPLVLAFTGSVSAWGQKAISAHSGTIHYVENSRKSGTIKSSKPRKAAPKYC